VLDEEGGGCVTRRRAKVPQERKERLILHCERDGGSKGRGMKDVCDGGGAEEVVSGDFLEGEILR
jgi:hypothetical protein